LEPLPAAKADLYFVSAAVLYLCNDGRHRDRTNREQLSPNQVIDEAAFSSLEATKYSDGEMTAALCCPATFEEWLDRRDPISIS
jgi:hypothetical protein